ncbi:hypothetical protein MPSEU_000925000 [Mayamaea pseudoterrestris]|nr:hypothetical protein MPSEU_000925000 [Mayamaea pseudoterrestris]
MELIKRLNQQQAELTELTLDEELDNMGMESVYELDPANDNATDTNKSNKFKSLMERVSGGGDTKKRQAVLLKQVAALQLQLTKLELSFRQELVNVCGPTHAASLRATLVGSTTTSLLTALQDRPLSQVLSAGGGAAESNHDASSISSTHRRAPNLFVTYFPGDASASQVKELREEVTAICQAAQPGDEVLVVLQTGGGTVTGYGLAAGQLLRLKEKKLKLTIAVEQVAASGGYMMCCVADHIVASPFAVLGSIGVISDIPNVYERLKTEGIEFQTVTAGKYKRTLTPTKKVTKEDYQKTAKDIESVYVLFRDFVAENRPQLDIENVATGETWFGTAALERKLCDEIKAVDDVIMEYIQKGFQVLEVDYTPPVETLFGTISPARAERSSGGFIANSIRWLVKTVAMEVKGEFGNGFMSSTEQSVDKRVMASDDTAETTRMES